MCLHACWAPRFDERTQETVPVAQRNSRPVALGTNWHLLRRHVKRPLGYSLLAVFLGFSSLGALFGLTTWPAAMSQFHVVIGPAFYTLMIAGAATGLGAARSLWLYQRRAPEWFIAWATVGLASAAYSTAVIMPQMMKAMGGLFPGGFEPGEIPASALVTQLVFFLVVNGLIYWYLASRRRRVTAPGPHDTSAVA